jgi:hypothetical protein
MFNKFDYTYSDPLPTSLTRLFTLAARDPPKKARAKNKGSFIFGRAVGTVL